MDIVWLVTATPVRPDAAGAPAELSDGALLVRVHDAVAQLITRGAAGALREVADQVLDGLATQSLSSDVDDDALNDSVRWLQRCESRVHAAKLRRLDAVAQRESFRADRERSAADWARVQLGLTAHDARGQVRAASAMARLPETAARLASGELTPSHAGAVARGIAVLDDLAEQAAAATGADVEAYLAAVADAAAAIDELDGFIAAQSGDVDPTDLGKRIHAWAIGRQPQDAEQRAARGLRHRGLRWLPQRDGDGLHTAIVKTTDAGRAQIDAAVGSLARKTSIDDERSLVQRQHDALVTLCQHACDRGDLPAVAAQRPHQLLIRTIDPPADGAAAPPALLDGIGPVGNATAQAIACDADTTIVTIDTAGRVWDVGRSDGDPSAAQRKAVIARDTVCLGCGAPASRCQIHHIVWRSKHGRTVVDNLVLVCWSCHQGLHHLGWTVTRDAAGHFAIHKRRAG